MLLVLDPLLEAVVANHKERVLAPLVVKLQREVAHAFRVQGQRFVRAFGTLRGRFQESLSLQESLTADDWLRLFDEATGATTEIFFSAIQGAARSALLAGAQNAIADVGVDYAFGLRNPRAEAYLQAHGYELISQIDAVTRGNIATIVDNGVREGWSYNEVAKEISGLYSQMAVGKPQQHIESRAHLIAVTEAGQAYEAGNEIVVRDLQDAGLKMEKKWLTVGDDRVSAGCRANEAEGWIPLERAHRSGDMRPLRFPGCRCTELYQRARTATSAPPSVEIVPIAPAALVVPPTAPVVPQEQPQQLQYQAGQKQRDVVNELIDKALRRMSLMYKETPAEIERAIAEGFQKLVTRHNLAIQFKNENIDKFLADPRFKTQFETQSSGGTLNTDYRASAEYAGLGIPLTVDPKERPIYGYLDLGKQARANVAQYGDLTFVLKDEVRARTTVTMDDSLYNFQNGYVAGTPITAPTRESWDGHLSILRDYNQDGNAMAIVMDIPYVEIQVQGGVSIADVRGVVDSKGVLTAGQRQRLKEYGIDVWDN